MSGYRVRVLATATFHWRAVRHECRRPPRCSLTNYQRERLTGCLCGVQMRRRWRRRAIRRAVRPAMQPHRRMVNQRGEIRRRCVNGAGRGGLRGKLSGFVATITQNADVVEVVRRSITTADVEVSCSRLHSVSPAPGRMSRSASSTSDEAGQFNQHLSSGWTAGHRPPGISGDDRAASSRRSLQVAQRSLPVAAGTGFPLHVDHLGSPDTWRRDGRTETQVYASTPRMPTHISRRRRLPAVIFNSRP